MSRVSIVACSDYDINHVMRAIEKALEPFGGLKQFVHKGNRVLLKPNMLRASDAEDGVTTHPAFLEGVVRLVQDLGADVCIGDSPSAAYKGIQYFWEKTGFLGVSKRTGAKLINFEAEGTTARQSNGFTFYIANSVFHADVVINLPKLKTHGMTLFTGAMKNLYGTLPGFQKTHFHKQFIHPGRFSNVFVHLYGVIKPQLHIMDAITGMAGNGPATGDLRNVGLILASEDGVALDAVASSMVGFKPGEVDAVRLANAMGLGAGKLDQIRIAGDFSTIPRIHDFPLPSNHLSRLVPDFLVRWAGRFLWVRPQVKKEKCVSCEVCARNCPVNAIRMEDGFPVMDYNTCINCLCCNESCPESAIYQQLSWLARRFGG